MNNDIKIAICEDEKAERDHLKSLLVEYLDYNELYAQIDEFESGEAFLNSHVSEYALGFLDIYLGQINGLEIARILTENDYPMRVVFCSSSREYAVESYDVSAFYYLLKPINKEKLFHVLDCFFEGMNRLKTIAIKVGRVEENVYISDILWIEAHNKKTLLHTQKEVIEASMPFSYFCETLPEPEFVKLIRYALVSVDKIAGIPAEKVTLTDGTVLPVSRGERNHVKEVFSQYRWKTVLYERKIHF